MSEHGAFSSLATQLIAANGRDVDLISVSKSGDDWNPTLNKTATTVKAVNVKFNQSQVSGGLIKTGDRAYLIDSIVPVTKEMIINDGGDELTIVDLDHLKPGDQSIMYRVHARK